MPGVVETWLTDKELDILIAWGNEEALSFSQAEQDLLDKLRARRAALSCTA